MKRLRRQIIQLYSTYIRKRDDRGSAIVIVIIAMAMIGILATTLLWMAYMNYMIKVADIRNKNSFYSAEEVVEQIMAGLQQESAAAVGVAYREVTANWENLETETNRYSVFATAYLDALIEELQDTSRGSGYYDREKLKQYIDKNVFGDESVVDEGVDADAWKNGGPVTESRKEARMEMVNNNSIILHDIYVSYTDSENRVSIVQTDICIDVPKLIFENSGSIDGLYDYTLIGNAGIDVSTGGPVTAVGSVYAGTDANGKGGLVINRGSTLTLDGSKRVISKGDILVEGPSAGLVVRDMPLEDNRVYAKNITLNSGTISLDSKVYVANDLALDGVGSKATLSKEYYGYGISTYSGLPGDPAIDSASSSAIIINGRDSTIDMTGVNRLLIAGRSYIGQSATAADAKNLQEQIEAGTSLPGKPVMMGESIAVKGGQIAYLVPAECIGTRDGETVIGQNPINKSKYEQQVLPFLEGEDSEGTGNIPGISEGEGIAGLAEAEGADGSAGTQGTFCEVDFNKKIYRLGNRSLSEFGVIDDKHIRKVFAPYHGDTLVYYYLVLDKTKAEQYFIQYYNFNSNREAIDNYFDKYVSGGILLGDFDEPENQYTILGNSLVSSALTDSGVTLLTRSDLSALDPDGDGSGTETPGEGDAQEPVTPTDPGAYVETGENAEKVTNTQKENEVLILSADIADTYRALTFNLTEDASLIPADPDVAKNFYVFNSIIKEEQVKDYLDANHVNEVTYETESGLRAVLTRNKDVNVSSYGDVRLIISLHDEGNVLVDKDFSGLIIAKGKITIDPAAVTSIKQNKTDLYNVLGAKSEITGDTITPLDMFVRGGGSMTNGAEAPAVDDAGNLLIDYSEIVRYMNWIKK